MGCKGIDGCNSSVLFLMDVIHVFCFKSVGIYKHKLSRIESLVILYYGRPWPAVYINFVLKIHLIQVLTEPLCRAQASFYVLPNNERGTKYRVLTYSARQNYP